MHVLALYAIKGGVGKTATAVNLAYESAREGRKTLLWDLDPQGASTWYFRVKPKLKGGVKSLVRKKGHQLEDQIKSTQIEHLDIVPADFSTRNLDLELGDAKKSEKRLAMALDGLKGEYDVVIFDCPPSISLVSENVFVASDALIVPIIPTPLSLNTYRQVETYIGEHRKESVDLYPFFSMADRRKNLHKSIMAELPLELPNLLATVIPYSAVVEKMGLERAPVGAFEPRSPLTAAYMDLWEEIRGRILIR